MTQAMGDARLPRGLVLATLVPAVIGVVLLIAFVVAELAGSTVFIYGPAQNLAEAAAMADAAAVLRRLRFIDSTMLRPSLARSAPFLHTLGAFGHQWAAARRDESPPTCGCSRARPSICRTAASSFAPPATAWMARW